jgi:hypothetical protein
VCCCLGKLIPPAPGTRFIFLPGATGKISWAFDDVVSHLILRSWHFIRKDGSNSELLASIILDGDPQIYSLPDIDISVEKPATLVLRNVNQNYSGIYRFNLLGSGARVTLTNSVLVLIARKFDIAQQSFFIIAFHLRFEIIFYM